MATVDQTYTADSLNKYRTEYNNYLSQWMSSDDAFAKARNVLVKQTPSSPSNTPTPDYQNQWAWNYVYNEKTWYYENQAPSNTPATQTPEVKQEVKQEETAGNTTPEIQQQGELKPLSQEYYNQTWDVAQSKIINNLNWYRQTNPELFSDYDTFKRNFSYDLRNEEQKQTLDNWYNGYEKWMQLSSVPTTELYTQYRDGQVSVNDLENLRISNPTKYAELQNQINKWNIISAYDDDKWIDTTWMSLQDMAYQYTAQLFQRFMSGDSSSAVSQYFDNYRNNVNSPEMLEIQDKTTDLQEQIENLNDDRARIKKEVEKEYEWTWATRSKINAIIADRCYELDLQLRTLNSEYNKYATQYNNRMNQYQNEFQMQLQEYQINQQARNQQMQELWFAMDLMNFETNEQKAKREWDYWVMQQEYTNWNINSKDYNTRYKAALNSVQNLLSQYEGIPMQRSAEQMADDILKAIDNWSNLGAELTKINQQIQGKPEYKYLYNNTYNPAWNSNTWFWKTIKIGDMEFVEYNWWWYTADQIKDMFKGWQTWTAKPYETVDASKLENDVRAWVWPNLWKFMLEKINWMTGGQCGKYVNDYLQYIGMTWAANRYYDDELSTKLNSINTYNPKQWAIAVFDYNHKSSDWINHWHVGIVTKVYPDWSFDVRDSNYGSDEKIQTRHITSDDALKWFFDPTQPPIWSNVQASDNTKNAFTVAWNNIALNLGSVSATNTFNEQLQKYIDDWNYTSAFEYITTQARNKADSDTRQAINSAESAMSALVSIQQWLDAFYKAWWDTWIFAGTTEQVANKIWKTTDPELKKLATQINVAIQKYRQAISWAAFSEQEAAEYAAIFPSTKNSKELNTALIDWTLQTMLQNLNSSYAQILGTSTYTDLLQAYQDSTWNIYDYYGNKEQLTKYLKDNWYMNTSSSKSNISRWTTWNMDMKWAITELKAKFWLK